MKQLNIDKILNEMTLAEKAKMLVGKDNMNTTSIDRLDIPSIHFSDGTNGIRLEDKNDKSTMPKLVSTLCYPSCGTLGCSWDKELLYEIGKRQADECTYLGINILLGPGVNIRRNPLCGRNFEYFSEDPILTGYLASSFVEGIQSKNVGACIKHYALNNNEKFRYTGDSICDERTLRDIYLKPFEIIVREAKPFAIMNSYNMVNGAFASENYHLLKDILRDDFGFDGLCITDWGGGNNRVLGVKATTDVEMPGGFIHSINEIIDAKNSNQISEIEIDYCVKNILKTVNKTILADHNDVSSDIFAKNRDFLIQSAAESMVLLKNRDLLPLNKSDNILLVGEETIFDSYQGSGSALVRPLSVSKLKSTLDLNGVNNITIEHFNPTSDGRRDEYEQRLHFLASKCDKIIVCLSGAKSDSECEGVDRTSQDVDPVQRSTLCLLKNYSFKVIAILFSGSSIYCEELSHVSSILYAGFAGEGYGESLYKILYNEISPSGRLSATRYSDYSKIPFSGEFGISPLTRYKESLFVGYRYAVSEREGVLYPFGYGLSYATVEFTSFVVHEIDGKLIANISLKNNWDRNVKYVIQVYVGMENSNLLRPERELKAFTKVLLKANSSLEVELEIKKEDLYVYDIESKKYLLEEGNYVFYLSESAFDVVLTSKLFLSGATIFADSYKSDRAKFIETISKETKERYLHNEKPVFKAPHPYDTNVALCHYETFFGKALRFLLTKFASLAEKKAKKLPLEERNLRLKQVSFIKNMISSNSLRSIAHSSNGVMSYNLMKGLEALVNNHPFRALRYFLKRKEKIKEDC